MEKILTKKMIIDYYSSEYDEESKEYIIRLLSSLDEDEFNKMIKKDFKNFIYPLRKGYYIEKG